MRIIGISEEHDSGVAFVEDGRLQFASNEERYMGEKFYFGFPYRSLDQLVRQMKPALTKEPVDVVIASRFHVSRQLADRVNQRWHYRILEVVFSRLWLDRYLWGTPVGKYLLKPIAFLQAPFRIYRARRALKKNDIRVRSLRFADHHRSHAAAAYMTSGWNECLAITLDASGDGVCSKVFDAKDGKLRERSSVPFFHSPGHYYEYITILFGFKIGREGKVTGLAAYGDPDRTYPLLAREFRYDKAKKHFVNLGRYRSAEMKRLKSLLSGFSREDIAAGVQKLLETSVVGYIRDVITSYGKPVKLVLAGGIFANVKLNQRIAAIPKVQELSIYPHMGDGGLAAGAAFCVGQLQGIAPYIIPDVYLGDDIDMKKVKILVRKNRDVVNIPYTSLPKKVAELLSKGKTVAVVRGRMEYGPRALGNRSLLYQATDPSVNDWLNRQLNRSEFMPFAPIVREKDMDAFFSGCQKVDRPLRYMTVTVHCNSRCKREAPSIVHVDDTARPQVVYKNVQPFIYDILTEYYMRTGLRILINTSFNMHERPIVRTQEDALTTFLTGNIDYMVLADTLIGRRP